MVRDVVERVVPNPTAEDIRSIKQEAVDKAVESGASPDTVEVHIEIDQQTSKLTAIALGSTEVKTADLMKECTYEEARQLAAENMRKKENEIELVCQIPNFWVFWTRKDLSKYREPMVWLFRLRPQATEAQYRRCGKNWRFTRQTPFSVRTTISAQAQESWTLEEVPNWNKS